MMNHTFEITDYICLDCGHSYTRHFLAGSNCGGSSDCACRLSQQAVVEAVLEDRIEAMADHIAALERQLVEAQARLLPPADLRTLASAAEATATWLDSPNDDTGGLMELARKVRRLAEQPEEWKRHTGLLNTTIDAIAALRPFARAADLWDELSQQVGSGSVDEVVPLTMEPYQEARRVCERYDEADNTD